MQMIGHQNVFADEDAAFQTSLAKLSEIFVNSGVGEGGFAVFGVGGNEVERVTDKKPVETFKARL